MAADLPGEVATVALDLTKFVIERVAPYGWMFIEIEGKEVCVVVAFDGAARRMNEFMELAMAGDGTETE